MSVNRNVTTGLLLALAAGCLVFLSFFPPYETVRRGDPDARWLFSMRLKEILLAMHKYHDDHGHLPPAASRDKDGRPLLSWRVLLLPFLDEKNLYDQFWLDEPWDSPHNKSVLAKMPHYYRNPLDGPPDQTFYQVFVGPGTAFEGNGVSLKDFPDGTSNTLLVVEATNYVPWTQPKDLVYDPGKPLPPLGGRFTRPVRWLGWLSREQPVIHVGLADGSALSLRNPVEEKFLRSIISRNGGEKVDWTRLE